MTRSRRTARFLIFLSLALVLAATPVVTAHASQLVVKISAGKDYAHRAFLMTMTPQIAIWLTDADGKYVDTIYVTARGAKQGWIGGNVRRPASLPIWSHQRGVKYPDGLYMPTKKEPLPDAITEATPKGSFTKEWTIPAGLKPGVYVVRVEINNSFDENETFRKDLPEENPNRSGDESGQPSLLWEGQIQLGSGPARVKLHKAGHGHPAGVTGDVFPDTSGLTSALTIIDSVEVQVR